MDTMAAELMYLSYGGITLSQFDDLTLARARSLQTKLLELKQSEIKIMSPMHLMGLMLGKR